MVVSLSPPTSPASSPVSSVSSLSSFGSCDDGPPKSPTGSSKGSSGSIKFMCSYGGKILPRHPGGILRYVGGSTRVLTADRSTPFSELMAKMEEMCGLGKGAGLRCQLPAMDLDALVSVSSDEDLANLVEEYDLAAKDKGFPPKVRAFLHPNSGGAPKPPPSKLPASPPSSKGRNLMSPCSSGGSYRPIPLGLPRRVATGGPLYHVHQRPTYQYPGQQLLHQMPPLSPQSCRQPQQPARLVPSGNYCQ